MPPLRPIQRNDLVQYLKQIGFSGPYQFMIKDKVRLHYPIAHQSDTSIHLLNKILKQAEISKEDWENLK